MKCKLGCFMKARHFSRVPLSCNLLLQSVPIFISFLENKTVLSILIETKFVKKKSNLNLFEHILIIRQGTAQAYFVTLLFLHVTVLFGCSKASKRNGCGTKPQDAQLL